MIIADHQHLKIWNHRFSNELIFFVEQPLGYARRLRASHSFDWLRKKSTNDFIHFLIYFWRIYLHQIPKWACYLSWEILIFEFPEILNMQNQLFQNLTVNFIFSLVRRVLPTRLSVPKKFLKHLRLQFLDFCISWFLILQPSNKSQISMGNPHFRNTRFFGLCILVFAKYPAWKLFRFFPGF